MEFYFNELSLASVSSDTAAKQIMYDFVYSCHFVRLAGFDVMRAVGDIDIDINNHILFGNYHVYDWKKDASIDEVHRNLLRDILSRCLVTPLFDANDHGTAEDLANMYFQISADGKQELNGNSGLSMASYKNSILISFNSSLQWSKSLLEVNQIIFLDNDKLLEIKDEVRHVSVHQHIHDHNEWISILRERGDLPKWKPSQNYFPSLAYSSLLIDKGDWEQFHLQCQKLSAEDRISILETFAKKIAERNGYTKNSSITLKNNRSIFSAGKTRNRIFLALDTMHGTFELCNYEGIHLGEFTFGGIKLDEANSTHGITL